MKLVASSSVAALLVLATGCGARVAAADQADSAPGGDTQANEPDTAPRDSIAVVTDTGAPPGTPDAAPLFDSAPPPDPMSCADCQRTRCGSELTACQADMAKLKGCNDLIMCINACYDAACANRCVSDSMSTEGKALLSCVYNKCEMACSG